jgi:hypothetical protein
LISRQGVVELRCCGAVGARKTDASYEGAALADFADDVRRGHFR